MSEKNAEAGEKFLKLIAIMQQLRAPGGCPWDRNQTFDTIKSYLLEETYEVMDAIDRRDWPGLMDELGDLLLQPVFFATMASEEGLFSISDSLDAINAKLVRRHPHVFGSASADNEDEVRVRWEEVKRQELASRGLAPRQSILEKIPNNLPALMEAEKLGKRAAGAGFEWPDISGVVAKIDEEAAELAAAQSTSDRDQIEHELGDLLFTVVNLARFLKVDPEQALRKTNTRFRNRFAHIEGQVEEEGKLLAETPLDRMEELWNDAKERETTAKSGRPVA